MSELHDPDLPAGAIVATHEEDESLEEGQVRRNDGVVLDPASKNPWYVLATVAGEQTGRYIFYIDNDLHAKNRRFWNGWMCQKMSKPERDRLAKTLDLGPGDLAPLSENEMALLHARFAAAFPDVAEEDRLPDAAGVVDLSDIHFPSALALGKCHFAGRANFRTAHFAGFASFETAQFAEPADFGTAHFGKDAEFSDGAFKATTSFQGATFATEVPKFYQRQMHQDTRFSDRSSLWPRITQANAGAGKQAYTRLRQIAVEVLNPDREHFFLRQEMRCKEFQAGRFDRWVFTLYRWVSDSGISVARPLAILTGVIALGWGIIGSWLRHGTPPEEVATLSDAPVLEGLGISFGNTLPFLGLVRKMHPKFYVEAPWWLDAVSGVQSVAGIVLLFFLGLGLRNRFRLK